MRSSYRHHYRRILPALLDVLDFRSNNTTYRPVIEALAVVRAHVESRASWYPAESSPPLEGVVPSSWEEIVTEKDSAGEDRVNRFTYELGSCRPYANGYEAKRSGFLEPPIPQPRG